ncbi:hypothetical protein CC1G_09843 [Coprinopsis cinerea okayama7|uniref:Uncharacterized protein n=1 Tax=Coprinopsis cinerea (strain Okayama-7 / 130 / ATCC MYA-4618 / FGSC 9003) TaxID=240176 RepID=A8P0D0_COPC7|nr:hypothetical protein CC1G_09843 [Coprinopsis cinerea okayama7\|eukprot:XP_001837861.1 hypothetical protein CC1G_09843 [Coprinopsis cinerea okayama7\
MPSTGLRAKLGDSVRRKLGRRRSAVGEEAEGSDEVGNSSVGALDPEFLSNLPIGADLNGNSQGGSPYFTRSNSANDGDHQTNSVDIGSASPANSFDSIDTISDTELDGDIDPDLALMNEKHRRTRKLLKYSRWLKSRANGYHEGTSPTDGERTRGVLALERKMARQEQRLSELHDHHQERRRVAQK